MRLFPFLCSTIPDNRNQEIFILEVWDFDEAEKLTKRLGHFSSFKGVKGFNKLLKGLASRETKKEFIGAASIPLNEIPPTGLTSTFELLKKGKVQPQGSIKVRLSFGVDENYEVASLEQHHLLKILMNHELQLQQGKYWFGELSPMAEAIVEQQEAQSCLTYVDVSFIQWDVFTDVHLQRPLAFELFEVIVEVLVKALSVKKSRYDERISVFWESTKLLLPSLLGIIRKIRKKRVGEPNALKNLRTVLSIIQQVTQIDQLESIDLFPEDKFAWLQKKDETFWDIPTAIKQTITVEAEKFFDALVENNPLSIDDNEKKLVQLITIVKATREDLQNSIDHYDKIFKE